MPKKSIFSQTRALQSLPMKNENLSISPGDTQILVLMQKFNKFAVDYLTNRYFLSKNWHMHTPYELKVFVPIQFQVLELSITVYKYTMY